MDPVEIIYIDEFQAIQRFIIELDRPVSVSEALELSHIYQKFPETKNYPVGIFGKKVQPDHMACPGDRIEIYRPLKIDPKEKRRIKAKK